MGDFPLWLAPVQARVLPISEKFVEYANKVKRELESAGVRVEVDESNEKLGYKIRQCELQKVPYMLIVGEKEQQFCAITVRKRKQGGNKSFLDILNSYTLVSDFLEKISAECKIIR